MYPTDFKKSVKAALEHNDEAALHDIFDSLWDYINKDDKRYDYSKIRYRVYRALKARSEGIPRLVKERSDLLELIADGLDIWRLSAEIDRISAQLNRSLIKGVTNV